MLPLEKGNIPRDSVKSSRIDLMMGSMKLRCRPLVVPGRVRTAPCGWLGNISSSSASPQFPFQLSKRLILVSVLPALHLPKLKMLRERKA
jgi:hypothetical protein